MEQLNFAAKLIEIRKAKGLTQEEVAEKCKITVRTIQRIESGIVKPRAFTIKIISDSLGFDFFDTSVSNHSTNAISQNAYSKKAAITWWIKDLFNLKTKPMKKVSILATSFVMAGAALFILTSKLSAQPENKKSFNSITIQLSEDKTIDRIEVVFSSRLTFDSLVYIKNNLKSKGITINYRKIEFEKDYHLSGIYCEVDCNDGYKGGFGIDSLDYQNKDKKIGFFRDYSKNVKIPFLAGSLEKQLRLQ